MYKVTPKVGAQLANLMEEYKNVMQRISTLLRQNKLPTDIIFYEDEWEVSSQQQTCESISETVDKFMTNTEEG